MHVTLCGKTCCEARSAPRAKLGAVCITNVRLNTKHTVPTSSCDSGHSAQARLQRSSRQASNSGPMKLKLRALHNQIAGKSTHSFVGLTPLASGSGRAQRATRRCTADAVLRALACVHVGFGG